jgi:hypothetical protein
MKVWQLRQSVQLLNVEMRVCLKVQVDVRNVADDGQTLFARHCACFGLVQCKAWARFESCMTGHQLDLTICRNLFIRCVEILLVYCFFLCKLANHVLGNPHCSEGIKISFMFREGNLN